MGITGVVAPSLNMLAKVSSIVQVLHLRGSYELVEKFSSQFLLTVEPMKIEVAWSCDKFVVSSVELPETLQFFPNFHCYVLLVDLVWQNSASNPVTRCWMV